MSIAITEFWSDFVDVPNKVMRKMSEKKIEDAMTKVLSRSDQIADIFCSRVVHKDGVREEHRFCMIRDEEGNIFRDKNCWNVEI